MISISLLSLLQRVRVKLNFLGYHLMGTFHQPHERCINIPCLAHSIIQIKLFGIGLMPHENVVEARIQVAVIKGIIFNFWFLRLRLRLISCFRRCFSWLDNVWLPNDGLRLQFLHLLIDLSHDLLSSFFFLLIGSLRQQLLLNLLESRLLSYRLRTVVLLLSQGCLRL